LDVIAVIGIHPPLQFASNQLILNYNEFISFTAN
jgi:hypothetical protein